MLETKFSNDPSLGMMHNTRSTTSFPLDSNGTLENKRKHNEDLFWEKQSKKAEPKTNIQQTKPLNAVKVNKN